MGARPRLPDPVEDRLQEIADERDISSLGETVRYVMQEAGYDV